jgi:S1-C subfamily serine protease
MRLLLVAMRKALAVVAVTLAAAWSGVAPASAATGTPTKGVVLVTTNLALENASAAGTGMVLTSNGEVLTNNHVIRGATTIKVIVPATHKTYTASVLGYDIADDVALIKMNGASKLATITKGNSSKLRVGQASTAVGNANGGGKLVITKGTVTGLNRSIQIRDDTGDVSTLRNLIQTSAHLVPGDSGGPLLDSLGRVIGMDAAGSAAASQDDAAPGYAIPINLALGLTRQIELHRASASVHIGDTAFIGIQVQATASGVSIGPLVPGSPAEKAGLQQGDVITSLDGTPVASFVDIRTFLFDKHPGDSVTLAYTDVSGNATQTTIVLASGPPQ